MNRGYLAFIVVALAGLSIVWSAVADDVVTPAQTTFTNNRSDNVTSIDGEEYYKGTSLLFTNCVLQTTGTNRQGLANVTVELKIGQGTNSTCYTGAVQVAAQGTWAKQITVPTNYPNPYLQIKITDSQGTSYIYPWKLLTVKSAM